MFYQSISWPANPCFTLLPWYYSNRHLLFGPVLTKEMHLCCLDLYSLWRCTWKMIKPGKKNFWHILPSRYLLPENEKLVSIFFSRVFLRTHIKKANAVLVSISRGIVSRSCKVAVLLYIALVRPYLDYLIQKRCWKSRNCEENPADSDYLLVFCFRLYVPLSIFYTDKIFPFF